MVTRTHLACALAVVLIALGGCSASSASSEARETPGPLAGNCEKANAITPIIGVTCGLAANDEAYTTANAAALGDPNGPDTQHTFIWILTGGSCVIRQVSASWFACMPESGILAAGPPGSGETLAANEPIYIHRYR